MPALWCWMAIGMPVWTYWDGIDAFSVSLAPMFSAEFPPRYERCHALCLRQVSVRRCSPRPIWLPGADIGSAFQFRGSYWSGYALLLLASELGVRYYHYSNASSQTAEPGHRQGCAVLPRQLLSNLSVVGWLAVATMSGVIPTLLSAIR